MMTHTGVVMLVSEKFIANLKIERNYPSRGAKSQAGGPHTQPVIYSIIITAHFDFDPSSSLSTLISPEFFLSAISCPCLRACSSRDPISLTWALYRALWSRSCCITVSLACDTL